MPERIFNLPENYRQVFYFTIEDTDTLMRLNLLGFALLIPFGVLYGVWARLVVNLRGAYDVPAEAQIPGVLLFLLVLLVLPLHEWVHGMAIRWVGYVPRYGAKYVDVGPVKIPYVFFATVDEGYFRRDDFIVVALAPVVAITLAGMLFMLLLPDYIGGYIGLAIIVNGSGAVGDLWMTRVVLRYNPDALVRDEADSIRVFVAD